MALTGSFNKLITKISHRPDHEDESPEPQRPGSPFIMLLSEGDEEFNLDPSQNNDKDSFPLYDMRRNSIDDEDVEDVFAQTSSSRENSLEDGQISMHDDNHDGVGYTSFAAGIRKMSESEAGRLNSTSSLEKVTTSLLEEELTNSIREEDEEVKLLDEQRSYRLSPLTRDKFQHLFDGSGRLVREHDMRKLIFKGGVEEEIRKDVWQFLFELYPCNTTSGEREILGVEHAIRYAAMKTRWKSLLRDMEDEYEGVRYCPKWFSGCAENAKEYTEHIPSGIARKGSSFAEATAADKLQEVCAEHVNTGVKMMNPKQRSESNESSCSASSGIPMQDFGVHGTVTHEEEILKTDDSIDSCEEATANSSGEELSQIHKFEFRENHAFPAPTSPQADDVEMYKLASDLAPIDCPTEAAVDQKSLQDVIVLNGHDSASPEIMLCSSPRDDAEISLTDPVECSDCADISEALADAMMEDGGCCKLENRVLPNRESSADSSVNQSTSFDIIPNALSNSRIEFAGESDTVSYIPFHNSFELDVEAVETSECVDDYQNSPLLFVNPHESLYSHSENFKSLDLLQFESKKSKFHNKSINVVKGDIFIGNSVDYMENKGPSLEDAVTCPESVSNCDPPEHIRTFLDDVIEHVCSELDRLSFKAKEADFISGNGYNGNHELSVDNENFVGSQDDEDWEHRRENFSPDLEPSCGHNPGNNIVCRSDSPSTLTTCSLSSTTVSLSNHPPALLTDTFPAQDHISTVTNSYSYQPPFPPNVMQHEHTTEHFCRDSPSPPPSPNLNRKSSDNMPSSPIHELQKLNLERMPPWIAQMIQASTPPTPRSERASPRKRTTSTPLSQSLSVDTDQYKQRRSLGLSSAGHSPDISSKIQHDERILSIVESAAKYLQAQQARKSQVKSISSEPVMRKNRKEEINENEKRKVTNCSELSTSRSAPDTPLTHRIMEGRFQNDVDASSRSPFALCGESPFRFVLQGMEPVQLCVPRTDSPDGGKHSSHCPYCTFERDSSERIPLVTSLGEDLIKSIEIQAELYAARQPYTKASVQDAVRMIDKDVPRTDRELPQFKGDDNPGLVMLRDALITFSFFHPDVGYAQGMNDIMSRFLVVMETEADAFWMFVRYMDHFKSDFMEDGMLSKITLVEQLLMKMDRKLYDFLQDTEMGLMFCHRWLLLNFKREFEHKEAVRLFEITSSRHLEVSSLEANLERYKERTKEFEKDSTVSRLEEIDASPEYPFDIFICVAMLIECREMIMAHSDISSVYAILSNLPTTLELERILRKSEELFYQYCRKTVGDCFQVIDELEVEDFRSKKKTLSSLLPLFSDQLSAFS